MIFILVPIACSRVEPTQISGLKVRPTTLGTRLALSNHTNSLLQLVAAFDF